MSPLQIFETFLDEHEKGDAFKQRLLEDRKKTVEQYVPGTKAVDLVASAFDFWSKGYKQGGEWLDFNREWRAYYARVLHYGVPFKNKEVY